MWQEARRQSKKIHGMLINYRKRAERRRDYYEKTKTDPIQFLQIYGQQCKIHITEENAMMTLWNSQIDDLIDRYDVRAHLDFIPSEDNQEQVEETFTYEERQINYERYRILAQNSFLKIPEEKFLNQLHLEEQFGCTTKKAFNNEKYNQEDSDLSDSDPDVDLIINTTKLDIIQANDINKHGCNYGMSSNDFYSFIINDIEEAKALKLAREEEKEKAAFSGRKSRRECETNREKILVVSTKTSPPQRSKSSSRSPSTGVSGKITYITSFGGDEEPSTSKSKKKASNSSICHRSYSTSCSLNRYKKYRRSYSPSYSSSTSTSPNRESVKVLPRYYSRKKINSSSSDSSDKIECINKNNLIKKSSTNLIIERLKRKRQVLINKQCKADKIVEKVKTELQKLEQKARKDELKELSIKLRKRQRESVSSSTECNSSSSERSRNSTIK